MEVIHLAEKAVFPTEGSLADRLLELTAISGEFPTALLPRLSESSSYLENVVRELKKNGLLRTHYRDKLRGYRLTAAAKEHLLRRSPERFSFYLTGTVETNVLKSEPPRRLRLHALAAMYVMMQNAGVVIFRDEKPQLFAPNRNGKVAVPNVSFYGSREIKELGRDAQKIRGSRFAGALVAPDGIYVVYHMMTNSTDLDQRSEGRVFDLMKNILCANRLSYCYRKDQVYGLLVAPDMELFYEILSSTDAGSRCFFLLDGSSPRFYYLTNDHRGDVLLWYLCSPKIRADMEASLRKRFRPQSRRLPLDHDAVTRDGRPVQFGFLPDLIRISQFSTELDKHQLQGVLLCFDFQVDAFRRSLGSRIRLHPISYEQFERSVEASTSKNA